MNTRERIPFVSNLPGHLGGGHATISPPQTLHDVSELKGDTSNPGEFSVEQADRPCEDWFEVQCTLDWPDREGFADLVETLNSIKAQVFDDADRTPLPYRPNGSMDKEAWLVGVIDGGTRMKWGMVRDGIQFGLSDRVEPGPQNQAQAFIRLTGESLLRFENTREAWKHAVGLLESLGCKLCGTAVTRVDVCIDLASADGLQQLLTALRAGNFIRKAKKGKECGDLGKWEAHWGGKKDTGFYVGKGGAAMCRVYDKVEQMKHSPWAQEWKQRRCPDAGKSSLRVEFQLRREFLKCLPKNVRTSSGGIACKQGARQFNISSVDDWFAARTAVAEYLCGTWLKITAGEFDRRHTERAEIHPLWKRIGNAFTEATGRTCRARLKPIRKMVANVDHLAACVKGLAEAFVAYSGIWPEGNIEDFVLTFTNLIVPRMMEDAGMVDRTRARIVNIGHAIAA